MIKAGTKITCENGHDIATVAVDINKDDDTATSQFIWHIDPAPKDGDPLEPCPYCGAPYIKDEGFITFAEAHTPDGWVRP